MQTLSPALPCQGLERLLAGVVFLKSAARLQDLPEANVPEIAIAGRSNAGKSTALNVICQRKKLAFASKTPGRTRLINLFSLRQTQGQAEPQEVARLVDLPGYGYAAVDAQTLRQWQQQLSRYLAERKNLLGLILVTDIRHALGPLDQQMLGWFGRRGKPVHILLTKSDKWPKLKQQQGLARVQAMSRVHCAEWGGGLSASLFSGLKRTGREQVLMQILNWLDNSSVL